MNRVDVLIDRYPGGVRAFLVLAPLLIGAYPFTGLINPLWGSLFGFPLYAAAGGHSVNGPHPWTETAAFLLWPIIVIALMAWAAGGLLDVRRSWRKAVVILWAVSAMAVVPITKSPGWFANWPIYGAFE